MIDAPGYTFVHIRIKAFGPGGTSLLHLQPTSPTAQQPDEHVSMPLDAVASRTKRQVPWDNT